jgi:hypothetical protein
MVRGRWFLFFIFLLCLVIPATVKGQEAWSGILDPSRAINWSNAGVIGGIPTRTTVCASLTSASTYMEINHAIAHCPSGQVVSLAAGTYNLTNSIVINKSGVTLRGAGPDQTFLKFSGSNGCNGNICVQNGNSTWDGSSCVQPGGSCSLNWSAGYTPGTTSITTDKAPPVNNLLILDQADETTDPGTFYTCDVSGVCHPTGEVVGQGRVVRGVTHGHTQLVTVQSVTGTGPYRVTISPGLYAQDWRSGQTPGGWWVGVPISGVGIENLSLDNTNSGDQAGINFGGAQNCWIKNIRSMFGHRNHVWLYQSSHITVQDSYFFGQVVLTGPGAYGVELWLSSDNLIQNNIMDYGPCILTGTAQGNVYAYNYFSNTNEGVAGSLAGGLVPGHDAGSMYNLTEGNTAPQYWHDYFHGTNGLSTVFRNNLAGTDSVAYSATYPINLYMGVRMENIIGNVLGTAGFHNNYEDCKVSPGCVNQKTNTSIYVNGFPGAGNAADSGTLVYDRLVHDTLMRWGNYDVVTKGVRWCGDSSNTGWATTCGSRSEVPTSLASCTICSTSTSYSNAVPSSTTLPASFYLSAKPSWWGTMPWPAIGPDVTGGTGPGGHAYATPAQACYASTPADPNYGNGVILFNANKCYTQSGPAPAPPTKLNAVVE